MGAVWEGVHATLGNRVACKFISQDFAECEEAVARFESEARAAASLKGKHIVDVYDHGVTEDGRPYIVMEYLEGETLEERIRNLGSIPLPMMAMITRQVSSGLARAHRAGIVHRDLKPENIFLVWDEDDETDIAKVVDFGIAKFMSPKSAGVSTATIAGSVLGSPFYMSPEQARGLGDVDSRADIWSLGVIVYEGLTGDRPFDGTALGDLLVTLCTTDPIPPSRRNLSIPSSVDEWMSKALNRQRDRRFQDVRQMAEALIACAGLPPARSMDSIAPNPFNETLVGNPPHPRASSIPPVEVDTDTPLRSGSGITLATQAFALRAMPARRHKRLVQVGLSAGALALLAGALSLSESDNALPLPEAGAAASPAVSSAQDKRHPSSDKIDAMIDRDNRDAAPKEMTEKSGNSDSKPSSTKPSTKGTDSKEQRPASAITRSKIRPTTRPSSEEIDVGY
jgi:serine/threonine-protein kinase